MKIDPLPPVTKRFLEYVQVNTQADPDATSVPSSAGQTRLAAILAQQLRDIGISDVWMSPESYVYATLPPSPDPNRKTPVVALLAHVDTAPDEPGAGVKPIVHPAYEGGIVTLPGDPAISLDPARQPDLLRHVGENLITSDGTTLLGSDDKAGVAILMQLAEDFFHDPQLERPTTKLCFTVDEEIGRGTDHIDLDRLGADVAYTLDGSSINVLFAETFNAAMATVRVDGVMVHPGYAKGVMTNALRVMCEVLSSLPADRAPESTSGREGYLHPHRIREGDAGHCEAIIILRDFTDAGLDRQKEWLTAQITAAQLKYPAASISIEIEDQYKNMRTYIEEKDPRAISFAKEAAAEMGIDLKIEIIRGGTDGSRLSEMGLPTPNVFNGGYDYHSRFEWNTVQNLSRSLAYTKMLMRYWSRHG